MMKFFDQYYDFYLTIKDNLDVDSKYIGKSGEPKIAHGKIILDKDLQEIIGQLECARSDSPEPLEPGKIEQGGQLLFNALFVDDISVDFENALKEADKDSFGLRILLNVSPKHTGYPWEIANYNGLYLATSIKTPFLRIFPGKTQGINFEDGKMPRVLSILSNVENNYAVDVVGERNNLKQLILEKPSKMSFGDYKDVVEDAKTEGGPKKSGNPSLLDIEEFLSLARIDPTEPPYNIIHFLAHGLFNDDQDISAIILQPTADDLNEGRNEIPATGEDLVDKFAGERSIGLVILNACSTVRILSSSSGLVPNLLQISPAVVAMRKGIEKHTAREFTYHFYKYFPPLNAEVAIQTARRMLLENFNRTIYFSIPVLYLGCDEKTGIPAKRIFENKQVSAEPWSPATNLNPAGITILTLLRLHDKSLGAEAKWKEWFSEDKKWMVIEQLSKDPAAIKNLLSGLIFGEFTDSLKEMSQLIHGTFSNAVQPWNERCSCLDRDVLNLVEELKLGNKQGITTVTENWKQNYKHLEKLVSHIVTARKEVIY